MTAKSVWIGHQIWVSAATQGAAKRVGFARSGSYTVWCLIGHAIFPIHWYWLGTCRRRDLPRLGGSGSGFCARSAAGAGHRADRSPRRRRQCQLFMYTWHCRSPAGGDRAVLGAIKGYKSSTCLAVAGGSKVDALLAADVAVV
jgi:hypothetical protein